jgi:hypothetical protein
MNPGEAAEIINKMPEVKFENKLEVVKPLVE